MKNPAAVKADGASKNAYPKPTKPSPFPQERLLWSALQESVRRMDKDANPVNRVICELVAAAWKKSSMSGGEL